MAADEDAELVSGPEYQSMKAHFVRRWAERELGQHLDDEQALAVGTFGGDVRVIARAGSGKTRTLVTRAMFLVKHCGVSPRSVLLLAFNRRAAEEIRERLAAAIGGELPHVMTFHALAHALVHPEETIVFDDKGSDSLGLSRAVQHVIDEHLHSDEHRDAIRAVMLEHFREDWEQIIEGGYHLNLEQHLAHRRALPRETLGGQFVKSHGEKAIANALFEHGIDYRYERNFRWNDVNYRPDFTLPNSTGSGGVVIEYFGIRGDPDYDEQASAKRAFWASRSEWTLLEFTPGNLADGDDSFVQDLLDRLASVGIAYERRSEEEIWELVRQRALDRFTSAMQTFVSRCRKRGLDSDTLGDLIDRHVPLSNAEELFVQVGQSVHRGYVEWLSSHGEEDFDGLMWRAIDLVASGESRFVRDRGREQGDLRQLRHVLVDEFQDFSQMFYELTRGIRGARETVEFFCVGDDWQAINAFAGSDLRFFEDFGSYFSQPVTVEITKNYRSDGRIVATGNALMAALGSPARASRADPGDVWRCDLNIFRPTTVAQQRHNGDEITPATLRLVQAFLNDGHDVVLLCRRNALPQYVYIEPRFRRTPDELERFLAQIRGYLQEPDRRRVTISTAHKYKGLEKSAVIVLDALERSYPLVHPSWIFMRVFGETIDKIEADERRLFYVAVSRAERVLALVTEQSRASPYLSDIDAGAPLADLKWESFPPAPSLDAAHVEICVFNAYDVRDELRRLGYRFKSGERCWSKLTPAKTFDRTSLAGQPWMRRSLRVEVRSETGAVIDNLP
jgi:DNA helicase-4